MLNNHALRVIKITKETADAVSIFMAIPKSLRKKFRFTSGQFISVTPNNSDDGLSHTRYYSLVNTAGKDYLHIGVKQVKGGKVSPYLVNELKVGDMLWVGQPSGQFVVKPRLLSKRTHLLFAGGSGITPIRSIIDRLLEKEPRSDVFLIYANNDPESTIYRNHFLELAASSPRFKLIECFRFRPENWTGYHGFLTTGIIREIIAENNISLSKSWFYCCGPGPMIDVVLNFTKENTVAPSRIAREQFTSAPTDSGKFIDPPIEKAGTLIVENNGKTGQLDIQPKETILDAALRQNIAVPHDCKVGICGTCAARLSSGKVNMLHHSALSEDEIDEGIILTCQAYPATEDISINLDASKKALAERFRLKGTSVAAGLIFAITLLLAFTLPSNPSALLLDELNTGHADLLCQDCHVKSEGTFRQQVQANFKNWMGWNEHPVDFGMKAVENTTCLNCHERSNDVHPTNRFMEPRFEEAREAFHPESCNSCHLEHNDSRITIAPMDFCKDCHQETEVKDDPLDVKHEQLITQGQWQTCLQCHDFHGNHIMETAHQMKDTIPLIKLKEYADGGPDPFGNIKQFVADTPSR